MILLRRQWKQLTLRDVQDGFSSTCFQAMLSSCQMQQSNILQNTVGVMIIRIITNKVRSTNTVEDPVSGHVRQAQKVSKAFLS